MNKKIFLILVMFCVVISFSYGLRIQEFADDCTYSSSEFGDNCANVYDGVSTNYFEFERISQALQKEEINITFNESIYLVNNVSMHFYCPAGVNNGRNPTNVSLYAVNGLGEKTLISYKYIGNPSSCGLSGCGTSGYNFIFPINNTIPEGFTYLNVVFYRNNCGATSQILGVGEIWLNFSYNASNELPEFNFTLDENIICVNNSDDVTILNLTIDVCDLENDTIYYSLQDLNTLTLVNSTKVLYEKTSFIITYPDYSFLENTYFSSDSCDINTESELGFNSSQINLLEHKDYDDKYRYMLGLSSTCDGDSEFTYFFDNTFYDLYYYTTIYGFQSENESLNISFYDSEFNLIAKVNYFVYNSSIIQIFNYDGNNYNQLGNFSLETILDFVFYIYNSENSFILGNLRNDVNYNISQLKNESVKYVKIENENGVIYQNGFTYSGVAIDLLSDFTLVEPTNISVSGLGPHQVELRVTDNANLFLNKYNSEIEYYNIEICTTPKAEELLGETNLERLDVLKGTISIVCNSMSDTINLLGTTINMCAWFIVAYYIITLIVSALLSYLVTILIKSFQIGYFSLTFVYSFFAVISTFLFEDINKNVLIIFAFFFVSGIIVLFQTLFSGEHTPSGDMNG